MYLLLRDRVRRLCTCISSSDDFFWNWDKQGTVLFAILNPFAGAQECIEHEKFMYAR